MDKIIGKIKGNNQGDIQIFLPYHKCTGNPFQSIFKEKYCDFVLQRFNTFKLNFPKTQIVRRSKTKL